MRASGRGFENRTYTHTEAQETEDMPPTYGELYGLQNSGVEKDGNNTNNDS